MRSVRRSAQAVLAVFSLFLLLSPDRLCSSTEQLKAKGQAALDASSQGRHEESYRLWAELLAEGRSSLGEELYSFVRSNVYYEAFRALEQYGDENCPKVLDWVAKGTSPGSPAYTNAYDIIYSLLIMAEGVCLARQEKYEPSYQTLLRSKAELRKAPPEYTSDFLRQVDEYLRSVAEHVISDGDYVTNRGLLQTWIGKVITRSPEDVQILITYANEDLGADVRRGQTVELSLSDCKLLGAISADAAMKGWRE